MSGSWSRLDIGMLAAMMTGDLDKDTATLTDYLSAEPAQDDGKPEAVMTMIENGDMSISWECSVCKKLIDDKEDIEAVKTCPHCGAPIRRFVYIEEDDE